MNLLLIIINLLLSSLGSKFVVNLYNKVYSIIIYDKLDYCLLQFSRRTWFFKN